MRNFTNLTHAWYPIREQIQSVVIDDELNMITYNYDQYANGESKNLVGQTKLIKMEINQNNFILNGYFTQYQGNGVPVCWDNFRNISSEDKIVDVESSNSHPNSLGTKALRFKGISISKNNVISSLDFAKKSLSQIVNIKGKKGEKLIFSMMAKGYFEKHIIKMKNYYRSLRNLLIFYLEKSSLSSFCKIKEEEAGLHFLLEIDKKIDIQTLREKFEENNILIPFLEDYFYEKNDKQQNITLVINYSGIKKDTIQKSVKELEKVLVNVKQIDELLLENEKYVIL